MKKYINPFNLFVGSFIPNWLLRRNELSQGTKLCYARLMQYAGEDGECFPSQVTLAAEIGTSERQTRRYIEDLEKQGLIECVQSGLNQPNRYLFLWHYWMEEKQADKKGEKKEKGGNRPDRTYVTAPDRTQMSGLERTDMSDKENHRRESIKTTTKNVVVEVGQIEEVRGVLAPAYAQMQDKVVARLIKETSFELVLDVARKTAHQIQNGSKAPKNPTGYFISLIRTGMDMPQGYRSAEDQVREEKEILARAACRRVESENWRERRLLLNDSEETLEA